MLSICCSLLSNDSLTTVRLNYSYWKISQALKNVPSRESLLQKTFRLNDDETTEERPKEGNKDGEGP